MKTNLIKLTAILLTAVLVSTTAFAETGLERYKQEQAAKEIKRNVCPLNEAQERRVYKWLEQYMVNFSTTEIIAWSPIYKIKKAALRKVDPGHISVKVKVRSANRMGVLDTKVFVFVMDKDGCYDYFDADPNSYKVIPINASTADMSTGQLIF